MSIRSSIPFRRASFNRSYPYSFSLRHRATKSTALARCVRFKIINPAVPRRRRIVHPHSSFPLSLSQRNDVGDVGGVVYFANLPTPPAEFDVRDNIEAEGDSPSLPNGSCTWVHPSRPPAVDFASARGRIDGDLSMPCCPRTQNQPFTMSLSRASPNNLQVQHRIFLRNSSNCFRNFRNCESGS